MYYRYEVWRKYPDDRIKSNKLKIMPYGIYILDDFETKSNIQLFIPHNNIIHIVDYGKEENVK
jgi:hypothetical protein